MKFVYPRPSAAWSRASFVLPAAMPASPLMRKSVACDLGSSRRRRASAPALTASRDTRGLFGATLRSPLGPVFDSYGDFGLWLNSGTHQPGKTLP